MDRMHDSEVSKHQIALPFLSSVPRVRLDEPTHTRHHADAPRLSVLGSVRIDRAEREFSSARAVDVIAYLAFHRDGASAERLKAWVWPVEAPPSPQAFANVMSRARVGLGTDDRGQPWLSRAGRDRMYRLDARVRTDVDEFRELVAEAKRADFERERLLHLIRALELVRGAPFGGGSQSFVWADHFARAEILHLIDETAHHGADLALSLGRWRDARNAAFAGLRIIRGCEQCFERRFRAAAGERHIVELRASMNDLIAVVAEDLGCAPSPNLVSSFVRETWSDLVAEVNGTTTHPTRP